MKINTLEAKIKYNQLLERYVNGSLYFENPNKPIEEKEKYLPNFQQILIDLNSTLEEIGDYEDKNILGGFYV